MGFWIIDPQLCPEAARLRLASDPPVSHLISALKGRPPTNRQQATFCFEYLSTRSVKRDFSPTQVNELSTMAFIPLDDLASTMVAPKDCYVGHPSVPIYGKVFTFVNFGSHANAFLVECRAKKEPTLDEIANVLVDNPQKFLQLAGSKAMYVFWFH